MNLTKRWTRWASLVVFLTLGGTFVGWSAIVGKESPTDAQTGRFEVANLVDGVLPSIVTVYVKRDLQKEMTPEEREQMEQYRQFFNDPNLRRMFPQIPMPPGEGEGEDDEENPWIAQTSGSGVIVSNDGYIVTNAHVVGEVDDKNNLSVMLSDDTRVEGEDVKLVVSDPLTDLALLKVNRKNLPAVPWGDSDGLRIGERVVAIGSPLDLRQTVTQGIVSAKHREIGGGIGNLLQTDAVINPGSSGGALINFEGHLVGINRLITTNTGRWQGYGFAIPSNEVREFVDEVVKTGKVVHGYIGIEMAPPGALTPTMRDALGVEREQKGVLIANVTHGGPSEAAGALSGDFIIEADGVEIGSPTELLDYVRRKDVGTKLKLTVLRLDDQGAPVRKTLELTVGQRDENAIRAYRQGGIPTPPEEQGEPQTQGLGAVVEPTTERGVEGLKVLNVVPGSLADKAHVREGDVLTQLNRVPLKSQEDVAKAMQNKPANRPHLLQFVRQGRVQLVAIQGDDGKKESEE